MPFTPYHFGPGLALHSLAPKQISLLSFCAVNVLIDLESLYNLVNRRFPVHAFFHTYVGATLVIVATIGLFCFARWFAIRIRAPDVGGWRELTLRQVCVGAMLGGYSHVVLDSVMHRDIQPLVPFDRSNPILGLISLSALHGLCVVCGLVGLVVMASRWLVQSQSNERPPEAPPRP